MPQALPRRSGQAAERVFNFSPGPAVLPLEVLDRIMAQYRVVQHGVGLYFGSAEAPNRDHLKRLKTLVRRTKTPWLSDHLC